MQPYIVEIIDESNISAQLQRELKKSMGGSSITEKGDVYIIEPDVHYPKIEYVYYDELQDPNDQINELLDAIIRKYEKLERIIILSANAGKLTFVSEHLVNDELQEQVSSIDVKPSVSKASQCIRIYITSSKVKSSDKLTANSLESNKLLIELFERRNKDLLQIIDNN